MTILLLLLITVWGFWFVANFSRFTNFLVYSFCSGDRNNENRKNRGAFKH